MGWVIRASGSLEDWREQDQLRKKLVDLYQKFFHPGELSDTEKIIERKYLEAKLEKVRSYNRAEVV